MKYHKRKHFHSLVFIIGEESVRGTSDAPARRKINDTPGPNSDVRNKMQLFDYGLKEVNSDFTCEAFSICLVLMSVNRSTVRHWFSSSVI